MCGSVCGVHARVRVLLCMCGSVKAWVCGCVSLCKVHTHVCAHVSIICVVGTIFWVIECVCMYFCARVYILD